MIQALVFGSFIISTRILKTLISKIRLRTIIVLGVVVSMFSSISIVISAYFFPKDPWSLIIYMILLTGAAGITFPVLNRLTIESSSEPVSSKVAMSSFITSLFSAFASGLVSTIYNNNPFVLGIFLLSFSTLAGIMLVKLFLMRYMFP